MMDHLPRQRAEDLQGQRVMEDRESQNHQELLGETGHPLDLLVSSPRETMMSHGILQGEALPDEWHSLQVLREPKGLDDLRDQSGLVSL